jgi:hypothetical protein
MILLKQQIKRKIILRGTQFNRSLQSVSDPDGPNVEAKLIGQNMTIKKTITTEYPESGRTVVKTYDDND